MTLYVLTLPADREMSNGSSKELRNGSTSDKKKAHPTFHFLAGLTSGVSSSVLLQPIDLLKTRVQQSPSHSLVPALRAILDSPHPVAGLWRGTLPSALRTGFGSALYFTTLSTLRQIVANNHNIPGQLSNSTVSGVGASQNETTLARSSVLPKLTNLQNLFTGAAARVLAGFVLMPVTVIKVRYESEYYNYRSLLGASQEIVRQEGFRGFFSGFGATAIRDAPYAGLYVVFYEASKSRLSQSWLFASSERSSITSPAINATSGVFAAGLATGLTNPFDAVKTRVQIMPKKYKNTLRAARLMLQEEGLKSFFDGLGLRMGRKAVSSALAWTVYEELIGRAERTLAETAAI